MSGIARPKLAALLTAATVAAASVAAGAAGECPSRTG